MIIAIDGAARKPGTVDCMTVGATYVKTHRGISHSTKHEFKSTSQRGELHALILALSKATNYGNDIGDDNDLYIITDSEYVYNTLTKDWIGNWESKGWITAEGTPVKNQDLWEEIKGKLIVLERLGMELNTYHIKGHLISIGKVTARKLLAEPAGVVKLQAALEKKYEVDKLKKPEMFAKAHATFLRNHGFEIREEQFKQFVVYNTVVDYIAGTHADSLLQ